MADVIGLLVLLSEVALVRFFFFARDGFLPNFLIGFVLLAMLGLYVWRKADWAHQAIEYLGFAGFSVVLGALFFAVDMLVGHFAHPELPLIKAGMQAQSHSSSILTVFICPGLTMIFVAGAARALYVTLIRKEF